MKDPYPEQKAINKAKHKKRPLNRAQPLTKAIITDNFFQNLLHIIFSQSSVFHVVVANLRFDQVNESCI